MKIPFLFPHHLSDGLQMELEGLIEIMWSTMKGKNNVLRKGLFQVQVFSRNSSWTVEERLM